MRWSVLKEEKEAEQMFVWKYLIMPILTLSPRLSVCTVCALRAYCARRGARILTQEYLSPVY